ncbi:MAG TPA: NUDIX hydrolase [Verrucomicrobia bacterium]|nr:NUDIX hydrolase [Verrucomicrobiota bacterium]
MNEVDWANWRPAERATLLFVMQDGKMLMIHKKRGLGAGKLNGPGGRLDPGEEPLQAAIRECQEELLITPMGIKEAGELMFQFTNGHAIHGYVFTATGYEGTPTETDEAIPIWISPDEIPYQKMWSDDRVWMPLMLAGTPFTASFLFDDDQMLGCDMNVGGGEEEKSLKSKVQWPKIEI